MFVLLPSCTTLVLDLDYQYKEAITIVGLILITSLVCSHDCEIPSQIIAKPG